MYLASRVCALGIQPGIIAGILNLLQLNALFVYASGLSMSIGMLATDEYATGRGLGKTGPFKVVWRYGLSLNTAVLPCRSM